MEDGSGPATIEELHAALDDLVLRAYANDLDFYDRGFDLRHDEGDVPDWEIVISQTAKRDGSER